MKVSKLIMMLQFYEQTYGDIEALMEDGNSENLSNPILKIKTDNEMSEFLAIY